ncbi:MAG TPA: hypothetical protein VK932_01040 [Kofleriaceae bacterium]|nr:hypothetical protein [Kofleriaceae bacterium]
MPISIRTPARHSETNHNRPQANPEADVRAQIGLPLEARFARFAQGHVAALDAAYRDHYPRVFERECVVGRDASPSCCSDDASATGRKFSESWRRVA